jgi:hypothetical protein
MCKPVRATYAFNLYFKLIRASYGAPRLLQCQELDSTQENSHMVCRMGSAHEFSREEATNYNRYMSLACLKSFEHHSAPCSDSLLMGIGVVRRSASELLLHFVLISLIHRSSTPGCL